MCLRCETYPGERDALKIEMIRALYGTNLRCETRCGKRGCASVWEDTYYEGVDDVVNVAEASVKELRKVAYFHTAVYLVCCKDIGKDVVLSDVL